jgi:PAS domain S-box-containing protein
MAADPGPPVLIAELDDARRASAAAALAEAGYQVVAVADAAVAVAAWTAAPPLLALLDLGLAAGELAEQWPAWSRQAPVVVLADAAETEQALALLSQGAAEVIIRPLPAACLLRHRLARVLERAALLQHNEGVRAQLDDLVAERNAEAEEANADLRVLNSRLRQLLEAAGSLTHYAHHDRFDAYLLTHFALVMSPRSARIYHIMRGALRLGYALREEGVAERIAFPLRAGSVLKRSLALRKPLLLTPADARDPSLAELGLSTPQSLLVFPLLAQRGEARGLVVMIRDATVPFRGQDLRLGTLMGSFCSEALQLVGATDELRLSERRYRELVENARSLIVRLDETGSILFANEYACDFLGRREGDLVGRPFATVAGGGEPELGAPLTALFPRLRHDPEAQETAEAACRRQDGALDWSAWTLRALHDERRQVRGFLAVGTDVTDRRLAAIALAQERDLLRQVMDTSPVGIARFDRAGCLVQANPVARELLALAPGMQWADWGRHLERWDGKPLAAAEDPLRQVTEQRLPLLNVRFLLARPGQHKRRLLLNAAPLADEQGQVTGIVLGVQDITLQEEMEVRLRQTQKMETVGQLAGGVAHDFNNLLVPILGFAEMLRADLEQGTPAYDKVDTIWRAGEQARHLVRQLLAFSRQQVLEMAPVDLNQVVRSNEKILRRAVGETVQLQLLLGERLGQVKADATQLAQVLMNLVLNAFQAMPRGGALVVETSNAQVDEGGPPSGQPELAPGDYVMLAVSDTGIGMDKATMSRIFEPFFTTKAPGEGTGLGLSTVYGIVKQHQGAVLVYSEPGRGSTFKVYLPRLTTAAVAGDLSANVARPPGGHETIAIVEDDDLVRSAASIILRRHGYTVLESARAEDCLAVLQETTSPVHLLLSDVIMPGLSGPELYQQAVALRPGLRVLYMSGYTERVVEKYGILQAGHAFLQKPFNTGSLLSQVRKALDGEPVRGA